MSVRGRHFTISNFKCTVCGKEGIPIGRRQSRQREFGHLKKLYCCNCKAEVNFVECNEINYTIEDYKKEIQDGVFKDSDVRKES